MFTPTATRMALARSPVLARNVIIRPTALPRSQIRLSARARRYATTTTTSTPPPPPPPPPPSAGGGGGGNGPMWIVLAALVGLGVGGYVYLKPVRDVAAITHQSINTVKDQTSGLGDGLAGIAQSFLPPGAFALYSHLSNQPGGINGLLTNLKDKDLQGVIDEVKKSGGDDAKRIIEKVEKKVKEAKGKVQDIDWQGLAKDLKGELPESQQKLVDMFIGKIPTKEDFDAYVKKAKEMGQDRLKEVEASAKKVLDTVDKAKKEGKGQADAYYKGLKEAAPADIDGLIKQIKEAAKSAGLPADQVESWLKSKAEDGKVDAEQIAKNLESQLKTASKFIPGNPKDLVDQVSQISPSLGKLLLQTMVQAGITDEKGNRK